MVPTRYFAPAIVPEMTGTALVKFRRLGNEVMMERWPVVAWLIEVTQRQDEPYAPRAHPRPITADGMPYYHTDAEGYEFEVSCLEIATGGDSRIWWFSAFAVFSSLEKARVHAIECFASDRAFVDRQRQRKAAQRKREAKKRAARRAERATASVAARTNGHPA